MYSLSDAKSSRLSVPSRPVKISLSSFMDASHHKYGRISPQIWTHLTTNMDASHHKIKFLRSFFYRAGF